MIEMIRDTLRKKRDYEAESHFLHHRFNDHRYHLTAKQKIGLAYLDEQLLRINIWFVMLLLSPASSSSRESRS